MKKYKGFTLIELIITLAIVGVLLVVGVPSLKTFMQGSQLIASTNELLSAFHIARSEAVRTNDRVTICSSSDGESCSDSTNWRAGWIVFVARTGDLAGATAACTGDANEDCLLRVHGAITDPLLSVSGVDSNNPDSAVPTITSFTFTPRGLPTAGGVSQAGIFSVCSFDDSHNILNSRAVVLSLSGRVRVSDNTDVIDCPATPPA